ncbi:hypothetical protein EJ997_09680 [Flaviflexus ciconiae]|uniref:Thioredoxin domain-containing protein n=1 Tax=Flaviflexus ciconiae TaxID=2496867 RepID=A0A3S9PYX9_9ACTO|nr:thioredoxin domain-containing protein [Flaviflexus ciconiae]AZQ77565.1 hypothetical protein EJ997_09680 [Flaviflexus ciconiae]
MSTSSPQFQTPGQQPDSKNRGLLITIIILLLVIIGLAIALILTISGDDDSSAGQSHETIQAETIEPDVTLGSDGGADSDASKTASDSDAATDPAETPTATVAPLPTEDATSGTVEDPDALLAEHQRDSEDPYALGDVDADIVVVQYADYRCGYCALWHVEVFEALEPYIESGQVRFEYRDHPVLGDASIYASAAARAAENQGLFWEYGDALYEDTYNGTSPAYDLAYFESVAERVGVEDIEQFSADLQDVETLEAVLDSRQHNLELGVTGTPSFIIEDVFVPGALDEEAFIQVVESKLP